MFPYKRSNGTGESTLALQPVEQEQAVPKRLLSTSSLGKSGNVILGGTREV